ncbi:YheC/YheD family protein [Bacillus spongiae]|uniref:YheC/YheD family protein n=1 Tax=Bacillus spongiae TaxID=2683610 RepID=A0ABU8HAR8_9BACI
MNTSVNIIEAKLQDYIIRLHPSLLETEITAEGDQIKLSFGQKDTLAKLETSSILQLNEIHLSTACFSELGMPIHHQPYQICINESGDGLRLGPLITVLTGIVIKNKIPDFLTLEHFLLELHEYVLQNGGFLYVSNFSAIKDNFVEGYYYSNRHKWEKDFFPLPDVIYNRIHSRKKERKTAFQRFVTECQSQGIPLFNEKFLSKWEVYETLSKHESISSFIPETFLYKDLNQLLQLLVAYQDIFIKPIHGSQGRDIIRLKMENDYYVFYHTAKSSEITFENRQDLIQTLKPVLASSQSIIQKTIPLERVHYKVLDFRILVIPNHKKVWQVISSVVRFSKPNSFVSNLAQGGEMEKAQSFLREHYGEKAGKQLWNTMKNFSIQIAEILSKEMNVHIGELGIDIAVDEDKQIWLIEVNSKPSKNFTQDSGIRPSVKALYHYFECVWLERSISND